MHALLSGQVILPTDPEHTIDKVVCRLEAAVRNLEGSFNSELLAFDLENFANLLSELLLESSLRCIVHAGSQRPHDRILENHVEALSDLVRFAGGVVNSLLERLLLSHDRHNLKHAASDLVLRYG